MRVRGVHGGHKGFQMREVSSWSGTWPPGKKKPLRGGEGRQGELWAGSRELEEEKPGVTRRLGLMQGAKDKAQRHTLKAASAPYLIGRTSASLLW